MTLLLLLLAPLQAGDVTARLTAARPTLALSDAAELTLTIEGAAPLRVTPPARWLDDATADGWLVTPQGLATTEPLPDGRERWTLRLRAEPNAPGEAVPLALRPCRVQAGTDATADDVCANPLTFRVETSVTAASPVRTALPLEPLPPAAAGRRTPLPVIVGAVGALLGAVVLTVKLIRGRGPAAGPTPAELFAAELDALANSELADAEFSTRFVRAVRDLPAACLGPDARTATAAELSARPGAPAAAARALTVAEAARYGGTPIPPETRAELLAAARTLLPPPPEEVPHG